MRRILESEERVVLVDSNDVETGTADKLDVHRTGLLHRAFSVFVMNARGEMLLQRRALDKYHTGGLWSNTSCGHPRPGEHVATAASRRLGEEMGFTCVLERRYGFVYAAELGGGLREHEYDHVFVGDYDLDPDPAESEVAGWRWERPEQILAEIERSPDSWTPWFRIALPRLLLNTE